ncbi:putative nucleic acid-binding protein [Sphingomonas sp. BE270]|jgi:predicted nucleic acid-binding protein|uniref:Ribonuclease VapC n=1 Tax=Sphingobium yanoikuyae TaxID=13690 RepID=A0A9X7UCI4_SPHYA|nr:MULTISPECIES: type II toxin-antitoxin system VapC family toxin [Alphaproteobacteria]MBY0143657.1 type II toxin-antitoxin system VapC family toxin [Methylorubrum populi]MCH4021871.1 type II toxin-antitoxin system VapC family toxin [Acetobacter sp.]MBK3406140.1 type II toxin-antitoxin system VapC family toxin [Methylorubrum rhodesianum]MCH4061508.1 type II toxin-antitoxin system VapC family toxin [Acetobacter sp.]MDR7258104.1 putative nucleic acid-binding protein [Sphingomonas sp. BE270]
MKYLLDTNVLRELGKTVPHKNVAAWLKGIDDADLVISALSVREIVKGVAKLRTTKPETAAVLDAAVSAIFDAFDGRILPIDRPVASAWGEMLAASDKHVDDTGLAATARVHGLIVVTRNIKDFDGRGVPLLDPFKAPRRSRP